MSRAKRVAEKVGDLPALPEVAMQVMNLVQNPTATAGALEKVILNDQALTAKVLRTANSAFYGARGEISRLSRAIVILGFNTLRSVVVTGASEALHRGGESCFKDKILWEHSVAVGIASRVIAKECRYAGTEEAYLGGLLHDVGKTVLDSNVPAEYQRVIELVYNEGHTFIEAENEVFGFDHADVGALVAARWNLAPSLREAIQLHHQPMGAEIDPTLCAIVSLANSLCVKLGIGPERDAALQLADLEATMMLTLDPDDLNQIALRVKEKLEEEKAVLSMA